MRIGIIGSGPAGLTAALTLEKSAPSTASITLLDRNINDTDYKGVEYGIRERACHALDRIGLKELALVNANPAESHVFYNARTQKVQNTIHEDPQNNYNILRTEFLQNLTRLLTRTEVLRQHNASKLEIMPNGGVKVYFEKTENGPIYDPLDFDILIAADGANSIVRSHYFPHAQTLDQGFSSIYMLIEAIAGGAAPPPHFTELANGTAAFYSWGCYATNIIFPEGKDRLTLALNFDHKTASRVWRAHELMPNVPWSAIDPAVKKSIAKMMARDTPAYDFVMEKALDLVVDWNAPTVYSWDMRDSDPLDQPYAPDANIVFLGDSVRAFLPTIGMGASLAIEDAQWLGTQLGNYLKDTDVLAGEDLRDKVFEPYREARSEIWRDLIDRARIGARNFINQHEMKHFEQASMVPTPIGKAIAHSLESTRRTLGV